MLGLQNKNTKKHATTTCAWVAFILIGISREQLCILCRPCTEIEDTEVYINGKANKIIPGEDYYARSHAHTMVHVSLFRHTLDMERMLMIAPNVQLLIDALSLKNVENTSAFADVTQLTMAEFDKAGTSLTTKICLMHMSMVMILKRYTHAERASMWEKHLSSGKYVAISSSCWPLQVCILPASMPRSDDRPAYTSSEHIEGMQEDIS